MAKLRARALSADSDVMLTHVQLAYGCVHMRYARKNSAHALEIEQQDKTATSTSRELEGGQGSKASVATLDKNCKFPLCT